MSALWDKEIRNVTIELNVTRDLELRSTPKIFAYNNKGGFVIPSSDDSRSASLAATYAATLQSWLYAATVELSQSTTTPPWTKDTWGFVPVDMDTLKRSIASSHQSSWNVSGLALNMTFETPALRAQLQCRRYDPSEDKVPWVTEMNFERNNTMPDTHGVIQWNATNKPPGLEYGYVLTGTAARGSLSGYLTCCGNRTDDVLGSSAIGHWTNLPSLNGYSPSKYEMFLLAKWIVGRPLDVTYTSVAGNYAGSEMWIWPEEPHILMVNCTPIIEKATASVVVEIGSGAIQNYQIVGDIEIASEAWTDDYLQHELSIDYAGPRSHNIMTGKNGSWTTNLTTRSLTRNLVVVLKLTVI